MLLLFLLKLLFTNPYAFLIALIVLIFPLLISITIHEWSHGMVAYLFGDPTPKIQGRLTFNPFAHLDPVGTLLLFVIGFGWAKPVMIDPRNIPGRGKQMLVALAGPASNFILAFIAGCVIYVTAHFMGIDVYRIDLLSEETQLGLGALSIVLLSFVIRINLILAIFNMMPIPPLDGSNVLKWFLPEDMGEAYYSKLAPYGIFILLIILFTGGFNYILSIADKLQIYIFRAAEFILRPLLGM